jgi:hypothetical protein
MRKSIHCGIDFGPSRVMYYCVHQGTSSVSNITLNSDVSFGNQDRFLLDLSKKQTQKAIVNRQKEEQKSKALEENRASMQEKIRRLEERKKADELRRRMKVETEEFARTAKEFADREHAEILQKLEAEREAAEQEMRESLVGLGVGLL